VSTERRWAQRAVVAVAALVAGCSGDGGKADGAAGAGGAGGASGITCGAITCAPTGQYCDWAGNSCAGLEPMGSCLARPQGCTAEVDQVCGCDGTVYSNPCVAAAAGQDISDGGGCAAPAGTFACGPRFCTKGSQFCERRPSGTTGVAGMFTCRALPAACGASPTCACLSGVSCASCVLSDGDLTTACPSS
jgi:hypothetical protein